MKTNNKNNSNNNIIEFPKERLGNITNIQSQDDLLKHIVDYKTSFANDISEILSQHIFGELARSGINFESQIDELFPSMILVSESIQSLQLKAAGVYHPLHDFVEDAFGEDGGEEVETEEIVDSSKNINYNMKNEKDEE